MAKMTYEEKIYSDNLTDKDKKILGYIEEQWYLNGGFTPSYREICKGLNIGSTSTVYASIRKLEEKGYIKKTINKNDKVKRYDLVISSLNADGTKLRKKKNEKHELVSLKVAKVPYIYKIKNKENIFAEENLKEYIAIPIEYGKEKNMYAFESKNSEFKEVGILNKSLVIFDTEERYISRDLVAIIEEKASYTRIGIKRYERGDITENILGKIVGVYTDITY